MTIQIVSEKRINKRMVNVKKGVLVRCDPAMRQLLVYLDESRTLGSKFVVKELDETHIVVDKEIVPILEQKIDQMMDSLSPDLSDK
ncbi:unnamed protein product [Onchocerca ochengi]|uniref:General transcription and DNA repair factor IIH subunit TFB5 n=2 Tax=Onchocerca TaxID=6281 RepID=A0A182E1L6_ONCOC|nr:unnamed protein product [Onchocerca ochengi]